ncbi:hypothetical protein FB451DRAFT_1527639 [Mycena latifolia]|nr:hypothetical protein FB451DRAFT_1527639 [Mycena latifolia]
MSDATCHTILSQSPGLLRIFQALWVWGFTSKVLHLKMGDLLYIRFLLHIHWDELWAIVRASHSLMGGRSIKKLSILLRIALQSTTICPEVYPWPSTCRDLARGCIRLLLYQDGLSLYEKTLTPLWAPLVRLSPPCDDLLADIRNLRPSRKMNGFYIHNVLEWLKIHQTFPQPPLDVIECWQRCLEKYHRAVYYDTFKEYEEQWTDFRNQMASRRQQEIGRWDRQMVASSTSIAASIVTSTNFNSASPDISEPPASWDHPAISIRSPGVRNLESMSRTPIRSSSIGNAIRQPKAQRWEAAGLHSGCPDRG